jgi:EAL domain-containing protein (putative c-di-GMP-specific phosphodiesterase class I)
MNAAAFDDEVAPARSRVVELDGARIRRAIRNRRRYRYVQPRVQREGLGWLVVSPNCSRNIDPEGGEIPVAWLVRASHDCWLLHKRDHELGCWVLKTAGVSLVRALQELCDDPQREFWP